MKLDKKTEQKEELKKIFDEHMRLPFPQEATTEELLDIKGELSLYGGHVAGLVSSYLKDAPINPKFVNVDVNLENQIKNYNPKTQEEIRYIQVVTNYKHKLDYLIYLLAKLLNDSN